ncbi:DUF3592 domain-containing protein [Modestobacter versicolor]|uniref:DUF3592 domain-containing protein n=1 Tax=Modestobacter versicolor TaxID=429133 RepID=UPI0034DECD61
MTTPLSSPTTPRPHRRAVAQLWLGVVPVLVVAVVLLVVLVVRLGDVRAPLDAATATATATVTEVGTAPDGRGLGVTFPGGNGAERTGTVELDRPLDVPVGAELTVRYDPDTPDGSPVHADGDAASAALGDVLFGLFAVVLVLVVCSVLTAARLLGRPRLRGRRAVRVPATHVVVRQGLLVRSWLELDTTAGLRWVPVHWRPELDRLVPGTRVEVRGDPAQDRLVLPVLDGAEVWPSGRVRDRQPRGDLRQAGVDPTAPDVGLARQVRADGVPPLVAPVLGLLWAYVDSSGVSGFLVATALSAAVLFWVPQLLGSDPRAPGRA